MEIKILRITRSFANKRIYYVDVEFNEFFRLKGCQYNPSCGKFYLPNLRTESDTKYTPFFFSNIELFNEFRQKCLNILKDMKMPDLEEAVSDELKEKNRKRLAIKRKLQREVSKSMGRSAPGSPSLKSPRAPYAPNMQKKHPPRVWSRDNSQVKTEGEVLVSGGKKFTEVPLQRKWN